MILLAPLMDSAHQPWMPFPCRKPDQFSQLIHLRDLMTTLTEGSEKVNTKVAGREEASVMNSITKK